MDLLLLHGALGSGTQFDALQKALEQYFEIHVIEFEGHGNTTPRERPFRMSHFAENVVEAMSKRSIASAALFGYSMGGYVALHLATVRPDLVLSVATLGTKFRWDPIVATREAERLDPATIRTKVPKFADALARRHGGAGGWEGVVTRTADLLRNLGDQPLLTDEALRSIAQRAMVIVGDRDNTVTIEESAGAVNVLRNGTLHVMPDTPHPIEQVNVDHLADVLRNFLASH